MSQLSYRLLLNVPIVTTPESQLLDVLESYLEKSQPFTLFTPNPEILLEAHQNNEFHTILAENQINIPDGEGVAMMLGIPVIKGRVFMQKVFALLEQSNKKIYFVGSTEIVISHVLKHLKKDFPTLKAEGSAGPVLHVSGIPITKEQEQIQESLLKTIDSFQPDMIFAAFGAPKQEMWVHHIKQKLPQCTYMVVGGALDTYSGIKKLPPQWVVSLKLEWLYRLVQEPERIGRIFRAVCVFPLVVLIHKLFASQADTSS